MSRDVEQVISLVQHSLPEAQVQQLAVKHGADDDGLWFFSLPGIDDQIQIESSSYNCPFIVEFGSSTLKCLTPQETADTIIQYLSARHRG